MLCHNLQKYHKTTISLDDFKGDGIQRAKFYLSKVYDYNFGDASSGWDSLVILNKLRNCIVHADSRVSISKNSKEIISIESTNPGIGIDNDQLIISNNYTSSTINNVDVFITWLYKTHNNYRTIANFYLTLFYSDGNGINFR